MILLRVQSLDGYQDQNGWGCKNITAQVIEVSCDDQCTQFTCESLETPPPPVTPPLNYLDLNFSKVSAINNDVIIPKKICVRGHLVNNEGLRGPSSSSAILFTTTEEGNTSIPPSQSSSPMTITSPASSSSPSSADAAAGPTTGSTRWLVQRSMIDSNADEDCLTLIKRSETWLRVRIVRPLGFPPVASTVKVRRDRRGHVIRKDG